MALHAAALQKLAQRRLYHGGCVYVLIELFVQQIVVHLRGGQHPAYAQPGEQHLGKAARVYHHALRVHRLERGIALAAKAQLLVEAVLQYGHAVPGADAQHLAPALQGHVEPRGVLVGGHAVHQRGPLPEYLALQRGGVHALRIHVHRADAGHAALEHAYHAVVRGRLREHARALVHQHARDQIHRLAEAVHYNQFIAVGVYAFLAHVGHEVLPERLVAARIAVVEQPPVVGGQHVVHYLAEGLHGERIVVGRQRCEGYHVPPAMPERGLLLAVVGKGPRRPAYALVPVNRRFAGCAHCARALGHERALAAPYVHQPLVLQIRIGRVHRVAAHMLHARHVARRGQLARRQLARKYRPPQLVAQLQIQWLAAVHVVARTEQLAHSAHLPRSYVSDLYSISFAANNKVPPRRIFCESVAPSMSLG